MHISENQYTNILTKCSKMTEETSHKRYGMNGSVESRIVKDEPPATTHQQYKGAGYGQGGRLKFFKDGKFILELERARDGERVSWVSVPRKTYWPPPGTATATPASYRQESSASLSVSDDNSSIQSSPWQRDHSWKQTTPTRNKSRGLSFMFWRTKKHRKVFKGRGVKRRRPHSIGTDLAEDSLPKIKRERKTRRRLMSVVAGLIEKNARTSTPPRAESVVSPRKRFLREMEKEKNQSSGVRSPGSSGERNSYVPEDPTVNSAQKRSRCRPSPAPAPSTPPSSVVKVEKMENSTPPPHYTRPRSNGIEDGTVMKPVRNSSYSITSLLAEDSHHRSPSSVKRSPSHSPSQYSAPATAPSVSSPSTTRYCSPVSSTEDRMYSESVDRLRSIELSHAEKNIYPPYAAQHHYGAYMYPFPPVPPYYYTRSPYMMPTIYHHGTTPVLPASMAERYHHQASTHQPMSHPHHSPPVQPLALSMRRESAPSCSWDGQREPSTGRDVVDHPSDMPLNLSKHSG